ncbi:hypothetical protein EJF18_30775 [Clavispora lusitaniae]|uniref:Mitochondrial import inner membrane translocase subunit n=3 Tax=Clavispora lusitaniae TaxID=36911 RepID=C4Y4D1_CLAL4|nr:uncharacterized protein CLUG_02503 [Clavispora lusitaniae ATCC 42720]KAF5211387.1 Mitochondrial import inner membrane translocase subunit tim8 [Clavispora lusitaniae]EEQ38377.1 conserved hypothetical protein [Clavispora lusitaniae ATCC 42720]KAF7580225.1 Mitochondrial import inner membrane translocase subunit TIM8 domain protein [Clavispora lusitaniae]QFZ27788.1 hypothetical protein EJF14_30775 [Clavispora lusitaniae]QFZ32905.1 hypothetical protein EJF16_30775 [Clavispora lusitaniae]
MLYDLTLRFQEDLYITIIIRQIYTRTFHNPTFFSRSRLPFKLHLFLSMSQISQTALQSLDDASRKEILEFIEAENSKSKVQMSIHNFTDMCFKKCNENKQITSNSLDKAEEQCLSNCLNRFLDTNIKVVQALQGQQ